MRRRTAHALIAAAFGSIAAVACETVLEADGARVDSTAEAGMNGDGPPNDALATDGSGSKKRCEWDAPFKAVPVGVNFGVAGAVGSPRLTDDELEIVFNDGSEPPGVRLARRANTAESFTLVPNGFDNATLAPASTVLRPSISGDGLQAVFDVRTAVGSSGEDIWKTFRTDRDASFAGPALHPDVNTDAGDHHPFIVQDAGSLWFASSRSGPSVVYRYTQATGVAIPQGLPVGASAPVLAADERTIYLTVDGKLRVAHRVAPVGAFDPPTAVPGFESGLEAQVAPGWLSLDQCRLYVTLGNALAMFSRPPAN